MCCHLLCSTLHSLIGPLDGRRTERCSEIGHTRPLRPLSPAMHHPITRSPRVLTAPPHTPTAHRPPPPHSSPADSRQLYRFSVTISELLRHSPHPTARELSRRRRGVLTARPRHLHNATDVVQATSVARRRSETGAHHPRLSLVSSCHHRGKHTNTVAGCPPAAERVYTSRRVSM